MSDTSVYTETRAAQLVPTSLFFHAQTFRSRTSALAASHFRKTSFNIVPYHDVHQFIGCKKKLCQTSHTYTRFLERKICNPLAYVADRLKKLRGSGQTYIFNVNIVLM